MLLRSVKQAGRVWCRSLNVPLQYSTFRATVETDTYGIPLTPTWSVQKLLSSYPAPSISPATFKRLHELSALLPPEEGTPEYVKLKHELEELIKLVEATKLIKLEETGNIGIPDGRVIAEGSGVPLDRTPREDGDVRGRTYFHMRAIARMGCISSRQIAPDDSLLESTHSSVVPR